MPLMSLGFDFSTLQAIFSRCSIVKPLKPRQGGAIIPVASLNRADQS